MARMACAQHDRLGLVVGLLAAFLHRQRHERRAGARSSSTRSRTSLSVRSRTPKMFRSRRASSSAMVSALIMPRSATTHTRAISKRRSAGLAERSPDQRRHVGGIARPHLRAHRMSVAVRLHGENHLPQVRAMVLAVAVLAQRLPASTLEVEKVPRGTPLTTSIIATERFDDLVLSIEKPKNRHFARSTCRALS